MTISSTNINIDGLRTAFGGGTGAVSLSEFYRGGFRVESISTMNSNIPTSGEIGMGSFANARYKQTESYTLTVGSYSVSDGQKSPTNYTFTGFNYTGGSPAPISGPTPGPFGSVSTNPPTLGTYYGSYSLVTIARETYGSTNYFYINLYNSGLAAPPNNDAVFTYITAPGVGTFYRSAATYRVDGVNGMWYWSSSASITNGTTSYELYK